MRKIDTWLFITFFLVTYLGIFWILGFILMPLGYKLLSFNNDLLNGFAITISVLACFISAFGLRSFYTLPASLIKLTNTVVSFQLLLNLTSIFWKDPNLTEVLLWGVVAVGTWFVIYGSFNISEKYFSKK